MSGGGGQDTEPSEGLPEKGRPEYNQADDLTERQSCNGSPPLAIAQT
jgi:hypothetical protein